MRTGPCIVVTLNERLDYFGSTVNIAARLPELADGNEIVFSDEIKNDPDAQAWLREHYPEPVWFQTAVKGFDHPFDLWRTWLLVSRSEEYFPRIGKRDELAGKISGRP